jgi:hypothetical protein
MPPVPPRQPSSPTNGMYSTIVPTKENLIILYFAVLNAAGMKKLKLYFQSSAFIVRSVEVYTLK